MLAMVPSGSASDDPSQSGEVVVEAAYRDVGPTETVQANRSWWDSSATEYLAEHGDFLGQDRCVWCPEGLDEATAHLLGVPGDLAGLRVLEIGCGAGQCSRWVADQGAQGAGIDLSLGMLRQATPGATGSRPFLCADARRLPFADGSFDLAFSAHGAVPFVADPWLVMAEAYRVLRPGGRWVFSVTHPIRWAFPDVPGPAGLTVTKSYFDRTPYVETQENGQIRYAEHHRTLGDRIQDLIRAGFVLDDLVEPEWPEEHTRTWGSWSPLRGRLIPGTAIFLAHRPH
jgi:SAM-dependent methyltransferase